MERGKKSSRKPIFAAAGKGLLIFFISLVFFAESRYNDREYFLERIVWQIKIRTGTILEEAFRTLWTEPSIPGTFRS
jgi:hypothetical protein